MAMVVGIMGGLVACTQPFHRFDRPTQNATAPPWMSPTAHASAARSPAPNPVVVIPGILGSQLTHGPSGASVWGVFTGDFADPATPRGLHMIALPMDASANHVPLSRLRDDVYPVRVIEELDLNDVGIPLRVQAYVNILRMFTLSDPDDMTTSSASASDEAESWTSTQFSYDWRRDLVEAAQRLHEHLLQQRAVEQARIERVYGIEHADVRFDLVAHSMGGLIVRYYLRYGTQDLPADGSLPELTWAGAEMVERVVLIGTPNAGSIHAFHDLVQGQQLSPALPWYPPSALGTMPSVYQLMPRTRHGAYRLAMEDGTTQLVDGLDPAVWHRMGWGLADPCQAMDRDLARILPDVRDPAERRRIALAHQARCLQRATQFHAALDVPATPPPGLEVSLFYGEAVPTASFVTIDAATGQHAQGGTEPGDGTVTTRSALLDEMVYRTDGQVVPYPIRWHTLHPSHADHLGLANDPTFARQVRDLLLQGDSRARKDARRDKINASQG